MYSSNASKAWKHFIRVQEDRVQCQLCGIELCYKGGSTSSMLKHLRHRHKTFADVEAPVTGSPGTSSGVVVGKSGSCVLYPKRRGFSVSRQDEVIQAIAEFCVADLRPTGIVDGRGFRRLVHTLEPECYVPSQKVVSQRICKIFDVERSRLFYELQATSSVALSLELWCNLAGESYLTATVHFVDDEWNFKSKSLATEVVPEGFSAQQLADKLRDISDRFGITQEKVACVTHDNNPDVVSAVQSVGWPEVACFAHNIHTCAQTGADVLEAGRLVTDVRKLVCFFKRSTAAGHALRSTSKAMNLPGRLLQQDDHKRWISTWDMFDRLAEQRWPVTYALANNKRVQGPTPVLHEDQWANVQDLAIHLRSLVDVADVLSQEDYTSASCVLPILFSLTESHLRSDGTECDVVQHFKQVVLQELERRYDVRGSAIAESTLAVASLLDPRHKNLGFFSQEQRQVTHGLLQEMVSEMAKKQNLVPGRTDAEGDHPCDPDVEPESESISVPSAAKCPRLNKGSRGNIRALLGGLFDYASSRDDTALQPEEEMGQYLTEPPLPLTGEPLSWWKLNAPKFPTLSRFARQYFCITANSVPALRVFSNKEDAFSVLRSTANPNNLDKLIFLHHNMNITLPESSKPMSRVEEESAQDSICSIESHEDDAELDVTLQETDIYILGN